MPRILIVEDEDAMRESMAVLLKSGGYEVDEAADGDEGFQQARQNPPDLIVSDVEMPGLGGYDFLEKIRLEKSLSTIPFVFLTGRGEKPQMREGMEKGADDYITKPFHAGELLRAIESRLKKHAAMLGQADKKLEELRGSISLALPHELRTPLHGILGFADSIISGADTLKPVETAELGNRIKASAARLHRVIENFLIYAQIELIASDEKALKVLRQDKLADAGTLIGLLAKKKGREYERPQDLHLDTDEGEVGISQEYLARVIDELVDNAFKFSEHGTPVMVTANSSSTGFLITVADSGRGMTAEEVLRIGAFTQFNRRLHEQQGTGLGLAIAKRLVEIHGGSVMIESEPGVGTRVLLVLPIDKESGKLENGKSGN
ncbi:MAG TPA: response regulator [Bacteroidota bacterium]|nr:response regulator [Bacteroidota bacterium]